MSEYFEQIDKRIDLYEKFLDSIWYKMRLNCGYGNNPLPLPNTIYEALLAKYLQTFFMLRAESSYREDAIDLINYIDTKCNGVMPENIQILFNEWLLERM